MLDSIKLEVFWSSFATKFNPLPFNHGPYVGAHHEQVLTLHYWSSQSLFFMYPRIIKLITMAEMALILLGMSLKGNGKS